MSPQTTYPDQPDLICLSHLRWDFVFQRPQHLMSRFARDRRVFFVEEPIFHAGEPGLRVTTCARSGVQVVTPHLSPRTDAERDRTVERLLGEFVGARGIESPVAWFYTPMALRFFPSAISPALVVYDCMDELSL